MKPKKQPRTWKEFWRREDRAYTIQFIGLSFLLSICFLGFLLLNKTDNIFWIFNTVFIGFFMLLSVIMAGYSFLEYLRD